MKLIVLMSLLLINAGTCLASQPDHSTIQSVVNAFEQSIITKDKKRFLSLFVDTSAPMTAVVDDKALEVRRALVEKINREENQNLVVTNGWTSSPSKMINRIISSDANVKESLNNIKILSDGYIATVYFEYIYYVNDKKNNWGNESWQMVKTLDGWKISSVIYSFSSKNDM